MWCLSKFEVACSFVPFLLSCPCPFFCLERTFSQPFLDRFGWNLVASRGFAICFRIARSFALRDLVSCAPGKKALKSVENQYISRKSHLHVFTPSLLGWYFLIQFWTNSHEIWWNREIISTTLKVCRGPFFIILVVYVGSEAALHKGAVNGPCPVPLHPPIFLHLSLVLHVGETSGQAILYLWFK
jgi:hypothetical protein